MKEARGNDAKTRLGAGQVEGTHGFIAGHVAAESGKLVFHPKSEFFAAVPKIQTAEKKNTIADTCQQTKSRTASPIKHSTSPRPGGGTELILVVNGDEADDFELFLSRRRLN